MSVTTDFGSGYRPPGVYIGEQSSTIPTASGLPPTRLVLIGRGQGGIVTTEQVPLLDAGVRLTHKGILVNSIQVRAVSDNTVVEPTEYTTTEVVVTEAPQDYFYDLTRVPSSPLPEGTTVWVSYEYVPQNYYQVRTFSSPSDVSNIYGPALSFAGQNDPNFDPINSPLTLASEIAFANGATEVILVPLSVDSEASSPQVQADLQAAYDKIGSEYTAGVVVPLTDGLDSGDVAVAAGNLRGHVSLASNAGYYRIGVFGSPLGVTATPLELLAGVQFERMVMAYASPEGMVYRSGSSDDRIMLGHQYLAAAYGGRMVSLPVQESLTRKRIAGFAGIGTSPSTNQKNEWAAAGVALTEVNRQGQMIVRHGTSTDRSNLFSSEPSLVRARDLMVTQIQQSLDNSGLIGSAMTEDSPVSVKAIAAGVLELCKNSGVFVDYSNLQSRIAQLNPSIIEVRFAYRPAFPLNYILVTFSIDLNTGDTELTETTPV